MKEPRAARRRSFGRWAGAAAFAAVLLAVAFAVYMYSWRPEPVRSTGALVTAAPAAQAPAPVSAPPPAMLEEASSVAAPLPPVDASDPFVRNLVSELSSNPQVAAWLISEDLIRRFTAAVANISLGDSPAAHIEFMALDERFAVSAAEGGVHVDPRSYARYDLFAEAFASLDIDGTATLFESLRPLIESAYRDLGYDDEFDYTLALAIERLLEVPVVEAPLQVNRRVLTYEFSDPELEGLDAAQRHFLRMGPRNVRMVQAKLWELAPALGVALSR